MLTLSVNLCGSELDLPSTLNPFLIEDIINSFCESDMSELDISLFESISLLLLFIILFGLYKLISSKSG